MKENSRKLDTNLNAETVDEIDVDSKYFSNISERERAIFEGAITMIFKVISPDNPRNFLDPPL